MMAPEGFEAPDAAPGTPAKEGPSTHLIICNASDRGLCGGINSGAAKYTRLLDARLEASGQNVSIACIGDKGRGQLQRTHGDKILYSVDEHQKAPTFATS